MSDKRDGSRKFWMFGGIGAAVLAVVGTVWYTQAKSEQTPWQEVQAEQGPIRIVTRAMGTVRPENKIMISPPVGGRIERILVSEGVTVRRGQILAWMSSTDRAALMDVARTQGSAEIAEMEKMYKPTPIVAPVAGTVIRRSVVEGQTVNSQATLFELSDRLVIQAQVDETDIAKIRQGQKAEIRVDSFPDRPFQGVVQLIGHQAVQSNNVNVYEVQMVPEELPADLKAGMSATVNFVISENPSAVLIPTWLAEGRENTEIDLFVRGSDGKAVKRKVSVGRSDGEKIEVLRDLAVSDVLLYKPTKILHEQKKSPFGIWNNGKKNSGR